MTDMQLLIGQDSKKNDAEITMLKKSFKEKMKEILREFNGYYETGTARSGKVGMSEMERRNLDKQIDSQLEQFIKMFEQVGKMSPEEDQLQRDQYSDMQKVIQDSYGFEMPSMDELLNLTDDELLDYFDAKGINIDDMMGNYMG